MSPEFIQKWEKLLEEVDKHTIPIYFLKKLVLRLRGKRQHTINIERFLIQGLDAEQIEEQVSHKLIELEDEVVSIEFILNVQAIADTVQPETNKLLSGI